MPRGLKRMLLALAVLAVCMAAGLGAYHSYLRKARIAFVGFGDASWAAFEEAGRETPYALHRFEREKITTGSLAGYHAVFIWGMGLHLNEMQREALRHAREVGTRIVMVSTTSLESERQSNLTDKQKEVIESYLHHGGQQNRSAVLHYVAREFAGKDVNVPALVERPQSGFFHLGDALFETLEEFEQYLATHGPKLPADAPRIAIVGAFVNPTNKFDRPHLDYFIQRFEQHGARVYPIFGFRRATELLEQVQPDLAVVFPHGRLARGNKTPPLLAELNAPCVSALSIYTGLDEWLADERGMSGGMLSQSITMPELDGVIEPIAITARQENERGIRVRTIIRDRIEKFTARAMNWLELRRKPNAEKRIVIVYYKAPGKSALAAAGLETCPSLWNLLRHLQQRGYDLGGALPDSPAALFDLIQIKGKTLGQWAIGSYERFLKEAEPELIPAQTYARWFQAALSEKRQQETIDLWGPIPGHQMVAERDGKPHLVVSRIRLGNVVIMPQPTVGGGGEEEDEVRAIHGTDQAAPHFYLGAYLWAQHGFQADAIVHFGTHGSLEFTYGKSACLSRDCWPDILIGELPHVYPYIINNVGEALVAKRRSYGMTVSHLTPPFTAAGLYGDLSLLHEKLHIFASETDPLLKRETRKTITRMVRELDLARDVDLDEHAVSERLLTDDEIDKFHQLIHEMQSQAITDGLHVLGRPFSDEQIRSTVTRMLGEPACATLLELTGQADDPEWQQARLDLARALVDGVLSGAVTADRFFSKSELAALRKKTGQAAPATTTAASDDAVSDQDHRHNEHSRGPADDGHREQEDQEQAPGGDHADPHKQADHGHRHGREQGDHSPTQGGHPHPTPIDVRTFWDSEARDRFQIVAEDELKLAFLEVLDSIRHHADGLRQSPHWELKRIANALEGGYVPPSAGGDPLFNPASVPTGRNLYSINAEHTPSEEAWRVGKLLAGQILARHRARTGHWPRQVAFTLWGGEFIRGKGTTLAEIMYLIGVRPVWNSRGTVSDVELIPAAELGRPRIDVLVQTSGQFRDAGASRITLLDKAVQMVANLPDESLPNFVRDGAAATEQELKAAGFAPKEARQLSTARIFGAAANRSYGTDIMGMVEKGDTWEDDSEVADRYLRNMGGIYRDGETWGTYREGLLGAAMQGTEVVVQPRSSNTWGPLSLDHVYAFMGGMSASIRHKTGSDPTGYFSDLRARGRPRSTTAVAAIREEARTTLWNPRYLDGLQREGAAGAGSLTETVRNMYGWNVMQPSAIDQQMWDETYRVFIEDKHDLALREYFESKNPYALQDLTSVMLETARKGLWSPSEDVLQNLARVHAELVARFGAGCSYETCGNRKLQAFVDAQLIAPGSDVPADVLDAYAASLAAVLESSAPLPDVEGIELEEKIEQVVEDQRLPQPLQTVLLAGCLLLCVLVTLAAGMTSASVLAR